MDKVSLDKLLETSAEQLEDYCADIESEMSEENEEGLSSLITTLTLTKTSLTSELKGHRALRISGESIQAIRRAIDKLSKDPKTEEKVNMVQVALFGTAQPFWNVLKDIQHLLMTVESLKDTRGKKTSRIEDMEET
jgi:hypothetical protein